MDFFIIGYPKSGTTSLYSYLKSHTDIFLPDPKEPHFFSYDYPGLRKVTSREEYRSLYENAGDNQLKGDASATVIHSEVALDRILKYTPSAKFIVLLREPVSAVKSFHNHHLQRGNEDCVNLEDAWSRQAERREKKHIPPFCREPKALQYAWTYRYREHLPIFCQKVPNENRLILVFEDMIQEPRTTYRSVLDFLGLDDDGRTEFGVSNSAKKHRSLTVRKMHKRLVSRNSGGYRAAKKIMNKFGIHPAHLLSRVNTTAGRKTEISSAFETALQEYFLPDVRAAEKTLGRNISSWSR